MPFHPDIYSNSHSAHTNCSVDGGWMNKKGIVQTVPRHSEKLGELGFLNRAGPNAAITRASGSSMSVLFS